MNGITTVASLPMGSGHAQALKPQVDKASHQWKPKVFPGLLDAAKLAALGYCVNTCGFIERLPVNDGRPFRSLGESRAFGEYVESAGPQFEPFSYTERS